MKTLIFWRRHDASAFDNDSSERTRTTRLCRSGPPANNIDIQAPISSERKLMIIGVENCGRCAWSSNRRDGKITATTGAHLPPIGGGTIVDQRRHCIVGEQATSDAADSPTVPGKPTGRWWLYWRRQRPCGKTRLDARIAVGEWR